MEHINKTLEAAQNALATSSTTSPDETSRKTGFPTSWTSALFKRFQIIYGHKFTSMYEGIQDLAVQEWANGLDGITGEQIKRGLYLCANRKIVIGEKDWPPTIAEFRAMCLPEKLDPIHRDYVALPKPPQDKDVVEKSLAGIRESLK